MTTDQTLTPEQRQHIEDMADHFMDSGKTAAETEREIAKAIDAMIPLEILGPVGKVLEAIDGPIIQGIVHLVALARMNPTERELRRQRRLKRKADRRARQESVAPDVAVDGQGPR